MRGFVQNKYAQAAGIALATGLIAALTVYFGTMTDGLDMRHTVKDVGLAFIGPFAVLVSVLPKITDIITPTIRVVGEGVTVEQVAPREEVAEMRANDILVSGTETTVKVAKSKPSIPAIP